MISQAVSPTTAAWQPEANVYILKESWKTLVWCTVFFSFFFLSLSMFFLFLLKFYALKWKALSFVTSQ